MWLSYLLPAACIILLTNIPLTSSLTIPSPTTGNASPPTGTPPPRPSLVTLPPVTGPYPIGRVRFDITDKSRIDPFAEKPNTPRTIVLTIYYPAAKQNFSASPHGPYFPGEKAALIHAQVLGVPNGIFNLIQPNSRYGAKILEGVEKKRKNLIVFSPGLGAAPEFYQTYNEELASWGYVVVAVDHPYDNTATEIPSTGEVIVGKFNGNVTDEALIPALLIRVGDVSYALDTVGKKGNGIIRKYLPSLCQGSTGFDVDSGVIVYGHSFGGSTAAGAILKDKRVIGGYDLDGSIQGPVLDTGFEKPFVLMGTGSHNVTSDLSWIKLWPELKGFKLALALKNAQHLTFSDYGVLVDLLGVRALFPADVIKETLGTIDGMRALKIVREYVRGFAGLVLRRKKVEIMQGPSRKYPEVVYEAIGGIKQY